MTGLRPGDLLSQIVPSTAASCCSNSAPPAPLSPERTGMLLLSLGAIFVMMGVTYFQPSPFAAGRQTCTTGSKRSMCRQLFFDARLPADVFLPGRRIDPDAWSTVIIFPLRSIKQNRQGLAVSLAPYFTAGPYSAAFQGIRRICFGIFTGVALGLYHPHRRPKSFVIGALPRL